MTARSAGLALLAVAAAGGASAQTLLVRPEPGVALADGSALVAFRVADSSGVAFPVRAGEIAAVSEAGEAIPSSLVAFTGPGAEPSAVHLLVDAGAVKADPAGWAAEIAAFLRPDGSPESRAVHVVGGDDADLAAGGSASSETIRERLKSAGEGPLWDRTLAALDRLSGPGPPARRVLLLVTDGEEARESRHPVTTCAEQADTARVSVWIVVPGSPSAAGRARLEALAERTGGAVVEAGGRGAAALGTALGRIRAAQALRLSSLPASPPLAVTLRPGVAASAPARAWIRHRRALGLAGRPFPWMPVAAALVAALLAGGTVLGRRRSVGRLRGVEGVEGVFRVPRAGITIGGALGNGLVVADPRVSRHHAVVRVEKGRPVLVDLRSSNGTKVNGRSISAVALRDGDRILLADAVELVWEGGFRFGKKG